MRDYKIFLRKIEEHDRYVVEFIEDGEVIGSADFESEESAIDAAKNYMEEYQGYLPFDDDIEVMPSGNKINKD
jgi:hypothetical protein